MSFNVVLQTVKVALEAKKNGWTDTGVVVESGQGLRITATGRVKIGTGSTYGAFPEGRYNDSNAEGHAFDEETALKFGFDGFSLKFPVSNTRPWSISLLLLPDGEAPVFRADGVHTGFVTNRSLTFDPVPPEAFDGVSALRAWLIFNDEVTQYGDNSGTFSVIVERTGASDIDVPPVTGGRDIPPAYISLLNEQGQYPAWCWVITPLSGQSEFYTSLDEPLSLGEFVSANGENPIPAATYLPGRGVDLSAIPTTLKLTTDGTDVSILNFDRLRLLGGYYFGASVEVFEVDFMHLSAGRWVAFSGTMGNAVVNDIGATVELTSWDDALEKQRDDVVLYTCPHRFCQGICHNQTLHDGPTLSDWTRVGTVLQTIAPTKIQVQMDAGFVTDGVRETSRYTPPERLAAWQSRLEEGQFTVVSSGVNFHLSRQIKRVSEVETDVLDIELRQSFVALPVAGTLCEISAGCTKTPEMCRAYDNFKNFGGFPFLPLADGVKRL